MKSKATALVAGTALILLSAAHADSIFDYLKPERVAAQQETAIIAPIVKKITGE